MVKALEITSCHKCPFKTHKGTFGHVYYVPMCTGTGKTLPYVVDECRGARTAIPTGEIPKHCPLPNWSK